jgi:hypothetical protein
MQPNLQCAPYSHRLSRKNQARLADKLIRCAFSLGSGIRAAHDITYAVCVFHGKAHVLTGVLEYLNVNDTFIKLWRGVNLGQHSEAAFKAADVAMQTLGGFSYAKEYELERKWRETRLYQIAPISTNMILSYIAQHVLGLERSF